MNDGQNIAAGWYHATGDPAGTKRYWDGTTWVGEAQFVQPQPLQQAQAQPQPQPLQPAQPQPQFQSPPPPGVGGPGVQGNYAGPVQVGPHGPTGAPGQTNLATAGQRIMAWLIDGLIMLFIVGLPFAVLTMDSFGDIFRNPVLKETFSLRASVNGEDVLATDNTMELRLLSTIPVALIFLWHWLWVSIKGATPGKFMMGIRIVRLGETGPPGFVCGFKRTCAALIRLVPFGGPVGLLLGLVSTVFLFADSNKQTVMDKLAGTSVVKKP